MNSSGPRGKGGGQSAGWHEGRGREGRGGATQERDGAIFPDVPSRVLNLVCERGTLASIGQDCPSKLPRYGVTSVRTRLYGQ